jgi:sensor histidine kinase regulating citrate/malate metabolism
MRAQRHDFINHLQVVYSLLQLGEHQEAEEYLRRVYEDLRQVGRLLRTENPAVNALLAAKSVQAEQRHIRLSFSIRSRLDRLPMEDWEFCRVLGNLIDNALDAAAGQNEPWTAVSLWEELADFRFQVSNNGPAIPRELTARIFEPGFTTKGDRGSGMGLYIVRTLLDKYGGTIGVESDHQQTVFSGRIPVKAIDNRTRTAEPNVQYDK